MSVQAQDQALRDALTRLEAALDTPVISGELGDWVRAVREALDPAAAALRAQMSDVQEQQFKTILAEDLEMARQVEKLKEDDAALLAQLAAFTEQLDRLAVVTKAVGRHESRAANPTEDVVRAGQALIARIRQQETALTTWVMEAYQRDRGTVD